MGPRYDLQLLLRENQMIADNTTTREAIEKIRTVLEMSKL
jgi:hypothetical protein